MYQQNYTNMIQTNICIGKYSNIFGFPNICHTLASIRHTEEGPGYDGNIGNMLAAAADQEGEPMFAEADKDQCYNSCE